MIVKKHPANRPGSAGSWSTPRSSGVKSTTGFDQSWSSKQRALRRFPRDYRPLDAAAASRFLDVVSARKLLDFHRRAFARRRRKRSSPAPICINRPEIAGCFINRLFCPEEIQTPLSINRATRTIAFSLLFLFFFFLSF